ncbi:MAG TPA: hypothetical protein VMD52_03855 [Patescibacteria group bacterium]|nr:hypothetical protein [Patescibacteria group bacterium]
MDVIAWMGVIKGVAIFAGIVGIVAGFDLLLGAKLMVATRKTLEKQINLDAMVLRLVAGLRSKLDKAFDADTAIIKATTSLRQTLDKKALDIDTPVINTQIRLALGALFLLLSAVILLLIKLH